VTSDGKQPRAIFFDVGETLLQPRQPYGDLLTEVSHDLGVDLPAALADGLSTRIDTRVAARTQQMLPFTFPTAESQRFWYETYHGFFLEFLAATDARRLAQGLLQRLSSPAGYALFEETVATLNHLRDEGYRLGIISNWEAWLPTLLTITGIAPFFDHIVISGVCGLEKPDPRIFMLALDEGGYRPDEVVYIGDRPAHDVEPAVKAGIRPILLDRGNCHPLLGLHQRIGSLGELPAALKALPSESV
jgi:putative hydrolase of the HAD superfamily